MPASLTCIKYSNKTHHHRGDRRSSLQYTLILLVHHAQFGGFAFIGATHDKLKFGKGIFIGSI